MAFGKFGVGNYDVRDEGARRVKRRVKSLTGTDFRSRLSLSTALPQI